MTKSEAQKIAKTATYEQLVDMMRTARSEIKDWTKPSPLNGSLDMGAAYNLFMRVLSPKQHYLGKRNMLIIFGDYFPGYEKPKRKRRAKGEIRMSQKPLEWKEPI